jgi:hypothetical protein
MIVHGKNNDNTEFRYVWARQKGRPTHKFHIAKRYGKLSQGHWSGKTVSICSHGFHWFKNEEVEIYEWKSKQNYHFHHCYFCIGEKTDVAAKIDAYTKTLPPAIHGKINGVAYRYVWARPQGKLQMRYHIARMFEGDYKGGGPNVEGTIQFLCAHYHGKWKRSESNVKEWNHMPSYYNRCDFCSNQLEKYEGLVYNVLDEGIIPEQTTKSDEEDIGVETEYYACQKCQSNTCKCSEEEMVKKCLRSNVGTGGREHIHPPYNECVRCKRRYAINVGTYIPLDGTGIRLSVYGDYGAANSHHKELTRQANVYKCVCDYPVLIQVISTSGADVKIFVGKNVIK